MSSSEQSPQLCLFSVPSSAGAASSQYEALLRHTELAESLGFDAYWIAQGSYSDLGSPSALSLIAAASQRTSTIRLGTAVIPLAFENPLRLAETAAVVDILCGGRLELGVGKGNAKGLSVGTFRAFEVDESDREEVYVKQLDELRHAFNLSVPGSEGEDRRFYPPGTELETRIWQATSNPITAARSARVGDGLQLHSVASGQLSVVQAPILKAYLEAWQQKSRPKVAVTRSVLIADSREAAVDQFAELMSKSPASQQRYSQLSPKETLLRQSTFYGTAEEIAAELAQDEVFKVATHQLFRTPVPIDTPAYAEQISLISHKIRPLLQAESNSRLLSALR